MGNGFQTVYCFCEELYLSSYRVPRTSFSSFNQQFQVLIHLLYHINLGFFEIRKSTAGEVAPLGVIFKV